MKIRDNIKNIIEPFTGNGDLITFIEKEQEKNNIKPKKIYYKKRYYKKSI
jgi:hypothetical protein